MQVMRFTRRKQKNFLPTLAVIFILWLVVTLIIMFVDPGTFGIIPVFIFLVFFALLFTLSLLFANTRRGLLLSVAITIGLILSTAKIANLLNLVLLAGIYLAFEFYFSGS